MKYVICIPSYKRAQLCNDKTLECLRANNIPRSAIHVFVADAKEYEEYARVLAKDKYAKLVVGVKGLVQQRQFIMEQFPDGTPIVFFDDDVSRIDFSMSARFEHASLHQFLVEAFKECKKHGAYIFGVYPVYNPFFRKGREEVSSCLNYIVGAFYGIINRPRLEDIKLRLTVKDGQKEDVERSLKYFLHDGIVLRFNKIGFVTKYYNKSGGLGTFEERLEPMRKAAMVLSQHYPEYGTIVTKKNGMTEFRLKKSVRSV